MFCREQVAQLRGIDDAVRQAGAHIAVVGNGTVEQARAFRDAEDVPFDLYVDPELAAYGAAGLRRGVRTALNLSTVRASARALRGGFRQTAVAGDPWQQGGAFVIARGGRVLFAYVSRAAGDHPEPGDLVESLTTAGGSAAAPTQVTRPAAFRAARR